MFISKSSFKRISCGCLTFPASSARARLFFPPLTFCLLYPCRGCQGTRPLNIFHLKTVKLEIMDLKVNLILKYNVYKWLRVYSFTASPSTSFYAVNAVNYNNQCIILFLVSPRIFFNCAHF